jgi:hypothetical protein
MTWSTVIRGTKLGEEIVECGELSYRNRRVSFAVASCSRYASRTHASVRDGGHRLDPAVRSPSQSGRIRPLGTPG